VQVNDKIGMTFSAALRSLLRQDPDVIMLGEIRDQETAHIAVQAALTGHLVLSTLHTNDAPSSITRLINLGVEPYLLSASVNAVLAQRLIRRICPECKQKLQNVDDEMREFLSTHGFDRAGMLIPTWLLLEVWVIGAALTALGFLTNDVVGPALLGGLVLIVMLIGFTVMQHAFAGGITQPLVSDVERRALALTGAGDMIWDWDVSADKVFTSPETEALLGLKRGALEGPAARWLDVLHPLDRDRFRAALAERAVSFPRARPANSAAMNPRVRRRR